jgi:hypothetical protein
MNTHECFIMHVLETEENNVILIAYETFAATRISALQQH